LDNELAALGAFGVEKEKKRKTNSGVMHV